MRNSLARLAFVAVGLVPIAVVLAFAAYLLWAAEWLHRVFPNGALI